MKKFLIVFLLLFITCTFASDTLKISFHLNHEKDLKEYWFIYKDNLEVGQVPYSDGMIWDFINWNKNFNWNHDSLTAFIDQDSMVTVPIGNFIFNNKYIQGAIVAVDQSGNISKVAASNVYFKQDTTAPNIVQYGVNIHK